MLSARQLLLAGIFRLPLAHHMDQLNATQDHAVTGSGFEAEHRTHTAFDGTAILLNPIIEILTLPDLNRFEPAS
jgi:hypothetical protein